MDQQNEERIDLNSASVHDLKALPGVDRAMARRIIFDRKIHGAFRDVADLARVEGVNSDLISSVVAYVDAKVSDRSGTPGRLAFDRVKMERAESSAVALSGTPEFMTGTIPLRNEGGSAVSVTSLRIENTELKTLQGTPLERVQSFFSIHPGQGADVPISIQLDPSTPPGTYKMDFVAGAERWPVSLQVAERTSASLAPSRFVLSSTPSAKTERQVVVRNDGNVPITIGDLGGIPVEDRDLLCRSVREAVKKLDNPTWDMFVGALSDELKKSFAQVEPMKIRTKNKPVTIQAGATAVLDLEIQNPKNVRKGRHYVGRARIYNTTLGFALTPAGPEEEQGTTLT